MLSRDPLAARIGATERRQRLVADVGYISERIHACIDGGNRSEESLALATETRAFEAQLAKPATLEQDAVEAGVD